MDITIAGRLGHNPAIRYTKTDKAVCDLSLEVNERVKRGAGYVDDVTWHRIVLWQGLAEDAQSLRKGTAMRLEGFTKSHTFETRAGETQTIVEIVADKLDVLDSAQQPAPAQMTQSRNAPGAQAGTASASRPPDRHFGGHNRSESVPKLSIQAPANGNRPSNRGVPRAQIPDDDSGIPF